MVKSLINKLRKGILIATAGLIFQGCELPEPTPYPTGEATSEPTAVVTAEPTPEITPEPTPIPPVRIYGNLQDNETDTNKPGEVKLYIDDILNQTDGDGNDFSFSVPSGSNVKLKGKINEGLGSYVRTVNLENVTEDENVNLRAVPYPDFDTDGDSDIDATDYLNFRTHMNETNISKVLRGDGKEWGLLKWNLDNQFLGIKIYKNDDGSSFTQEQAEFIRDKIKENGNIEQFIEGRQLDNKIEIIEEEFTSPASYYYISVIPDSVMAPPGRTQPFFINYREILKVIIEMDPDCVRSDNPALIHEFGHAFIAPNIFDGHAHTLSPEDTIMRPADSTIFQPGVADIKAGKLVYEDTYNPGEKLDDILGMGSL